MRLTIVLALLATAKAAEHVVNQTTCAGTTYKYTGLAGYGFLPSNATDKYGDTIGGIGSSIAINQSTWHKTGTDRYSGTIYATPDRGWNTNGTLNFQSRIHKFTLTLTLNETATPKNPSPPNIHLQYLDTTLLTDPTGEPLTALDPTTHTTYPNFPPLPASVYPGNGYGRPGNTTKRISLDSEGLALDTQDNGFWISDEYGPYIYKFSNTGRMQHAIQPPSAFLPRRNGSVSFNSDSSPLYDPDQTPEPAEPQSGRGNNQGFEGLALSNGMLYVLLQSALVQEGGGAERTRRPVRMLGYNITAEKPVLVSEHVVLLPVYRDESGNVLVAGQSEIHQLNTGDFLVLARDSDLGRGQEETRSLYRHADVFSISNSNLTVTNLKGIKGYDEAEGAIASSEGVLRPGINPAEYCSFLDYNVNSELGKFRLHNGGPSDEFLLNEKWESLAVVPINPSAGSGYQSAGEKEYLLFSFSDNDFITQDGHMNFGKFGYKDTSGYNLDTQMLAFKLKF